MTTAPTNQPAQVLMPDPAELLIKEAREKARRRRFRWASIFTLLVAACLIEIGVVHYAFTPTRTSGGRSDTSANALTCPSARVRLLGVTAMAGGLGHGGVLVRASVTSSPACTMSGYPIVGAQLTNHSTAMARGVRNAYLGGGMTTTAPLPRLSITSRPRVVSFTIDMEAGGGVPSTCPSIDSVQITLPGSREILTADTTSEPPFGVFRGMGTYCSDLQVTPLVKGSSGRS